MGWGKALIFDHACSFFFSELTLMSYNPPSCSHSLEVFDRSGAESILISTDNDMAGTTVETAS